MKVGSYELLFDLASGGMGSVHVARQAGAAGFERLVVIKRVHRHLLQGDPEFRERFQREARISAAIRHPNVVSVIDVVDAGEELFLVLEYVESVSLSELVRIAKARGTRLPRAVVSRIVCDALAGLHAAHEAVDLRGEKLGLIHRDVSPQNIIVGVDGTSRIIDFGIAKAAAYASSTRSGQVLGKLSYLSPEQVKRLELDRRADIFAAGATLFEALTTKRLFTGEDEGDVLLGILAAEAPSLREEPEPYDAALDAVLAKSLERNRDDRFQTADELREALERALPPANTRDVTNVVREYAEERLGERRAAIAQRVSVEPSAPASVSPESATSAAVTRTVPLAPSAMPQAKVTKRRVVLVAALAFVAAFALALVARFGARAEPTNSATREPASVASSVESSPSVSAPSSVAPSTAAAPPSAASIMTSATGSSTTPPPPKRRPGRTAPRSKASDLHESPY